MRTDKEIEEQIKEGEEFINEHPRSAFGTDNKKNFELFKKIIGRFRKNNSLEELEDFVYDAYEGDELMFASSVVGWLRGDEDPIY